VASGDGAAELTMSTRISLVAGQHHVEAHEVARTDLEVDLLVRVGGREVGVVQLAGYYDTRAAVLNTDVLLWAGTRICRVVPGTGTLEVLRWEDEVRHIVPLGEVWCVQGELTVILYNPKSHEIVARYDHSEVIVDMERSGDRLVLTDFNGTTIVLSVDDLRPVGE
jgi:hypothetical protein